MKTNDILQEKYRVQKQLAEAAQNIHDYFARTHESAQKLLNGIGTASHSQQSTKRDSS